MSVRNIGDAGSYSVIPLEIDLSDPKDSVDLRHDSNPTCLDSKCYQVAVSNLLNNTPKRYARTPAAICIKTTLIVISILVGISVVSASTSLVDRTSIADMPALSIFLKAMLGGMYFFNYRLCYMTFVVIMILDKIIYELAATESTLPIIGAAMPLLDGEESGAPREIKSTRRNPGSKFCVTARVAASVVGGGIGQIAYVFLAQKYNSGPSRPIMMALNALDILDPAGSIYLSTRSSFWSRKYLKGTPLKLFSIQQEMIGIMDAVLSDYVQGRNHLAIQSEFSRIREYACDDHRKTQLLIDYIFKPSIPSAGAGVSFLEGTEVSTLPPKACCTVEKAKVAAAWVFGGALTVTQLFVTWLLCIDGMSFTDSPGKYFLGALTVLFSAYLIKKFMIDATYQGIGGIQCSSSHSSETYIGERLRPEISSRLRKANQILALPSATLSVAIARDYLSSLWSKVSVGGLHGISSIFYGYLTGRGLSESLLEYSIERSGTAEQKADLLLYHSLLEFREILEGANPVGIAKFLACFDSSAATSINSLVSKHKITWNEIERFLTA